MAIILSGASRFNVIDLNQLGTMVVLEDVDIEAMIAGHMLRFKEIWHEHDPPAAAEYDVGDLEFDPIKILMETYVLFEMMLRDRVNQAARAVTLAFAISTDLDAIASRYPVGPRLPIVDNPRDYETNPEDYESDDRYRRRTQLSLNPLSPHGPSGAYMYWALTADPNLKDATEVAREGDRSEVIVTCMDDNPAEPRPSQARLLAIRAYMMEAYRKAATDVLVVAAPRVIDIEYDIQVWFYPPPDKDTLLNNIRASLEALIEDQRWLGHDHTRMAIDASIFREGVHRAVILSPAEDVLATPRDVVRVHDANGVPRIRLTYMGRSE